MNSVLQMIDLVFKMMNFVSKLDGSGNLTRVEGCHGERSADKSSDSTRGVYIRGGVRTHLDHS